MPEYYIIVEKDKFSLKLFHNSEIIKEFQVAIGKNSGDKQKVGDWRTPEGDFKIESIEPSANWQFDYGDGKGPVKAYGPWFIRLETKADQTISGNTWTGIGIHGTHDESSIGKCLTRGCLRLHNNDLLELVEFLKNLPDLHIPVLIRSTLNKNDDNIS